MSEQLYTVIIGGGEFDLAGEAGEVVRTGVTAGEAATLVWQLRQQGLNARLIQE